jgi:hypothetical protein
MAKRTQSIEREFCPSIGPGHGYPAGVRAAVAMFRTLEQSASLCDACDMGWDSASVSRPQLNAVARYIETLSAAAMRRSLKAFVPWSRQVSPQCRSHRQALLSFSAQNSLCLRASCCDEPISEELTRFRCQRSNARPIQELRGSRAPWHGE